jgi:hypothetical protein
MAILQEHNTIKLARKLESFLTPAGRTEPARSLLEIRDRYRALRGEPTTIGESKPLDDGFRAMGNSRI